MDSGFWIRMCLKGNNTSWIHGGIWTLATSWEAQCHPIKQKVTSSLCQLEKLKGTKCLFYLYRKTFTGWHCFGSWFQHNYVLGGVKNVNESKTRILRKQQKRKMCQYLPHHLLFFRAKRKNVILHFDVSFGVCRQGGWTCNINITLHFYFVNMVPT